MNFKIIDNFFLNLSKDFNAFNLCVIKWNKYLG